RRAEGAETLQQLAGRRVGIAPRVLADRVELRGTGQTVEHRGDRTGAVGDRQAVEAFAQLLSAARGDLGQPHPEHAHGPHAEPLAYAASHWSRTLGHVCCSTRARACWAMSRAPEGSSRSADTASTIAPG